MENDPSRGEVIFYSVAVLVAFWFLSFSWICFRYRSLWRSLVTKGERSSYSKSLAVQSLRWDDIFLVEDRLWYGSYLNLAREMVTTCMDQLWQPIPPVIRLREE